MDQHATDVLSSPGGGAARDWDQLRSGVPGVWARYTDLVVAHGSGSWLVTTDGRRYLDYTSGIGVTNTGHAHPRVVQAIADQAGRVIHAQQNIVHHQPGLALHERLPQRFPNAAAGGAHGLFLSNSGAEAIEAAIKLAKHVTRRPALVAFRGGFHGRTHAAMTLTSSTVKYRAHHEPLLGGVYLAPYPYALRNPTGRSEAAAVQFAMDSLDELFATLVAPDDVAAIVVEPILGEGGYVPAPVEFLARLREIADRHDILLVVDEVQTGFGRTGRFFATEWTDATPDIVVMAKGIASGMPLSGILARRDLLDRWTPSAHGGTYGGNAVACAAALATLDVIDDEGLVANAELQGDRLLAGLRRVAGGRPGVAEVRGRGLMAAIEFAEGDRLTPRPDLAKGLLAAALARNLLLLSCGTYGHVVRVIPPLVTTAEEVDLALDTIAASLDVIGA